MLGTGNALVTRCYNTCFVMQTPGARLLVDAGGGNGVLRQLELAGITPDSLSALYLTHAHTDHVLGAVWVEKRYTDVKEAFRICGLSLGAVLALDYAIHHKGKVDSLILIGVQYKTPALLIDFQNFIFRCMPEKAFSDMGVSKQDMIRLCHSMRSLDFTTRLKEISCPVKILCGEKDRANLKASRQLSELLPQAELHIIPGAGHEINKCAPETIADILNS